MERTVFQYVRDVTILGSGGLIVLGGSLYFLSRYNKRFDRFLDSLIDKFYHLDKEPLEDKNKDYRNY